MEINQLPTQKLCWDLEDNFIVPSVAKMIYGCFSYMDQFVMIDIIEHVHCATIPWLFGGSCFVYSTDVGNANWDDEDDSSPS